MADKALLRILTPAGSTEYPEQPVGPVLGQRHIPSVARAASDVRKLPIDDQVRGSKHLSGVDPASGGAGVCQSHSNGAKLPPQRRGTC